MSHFYGTWRFKRCSQEPFIGSCPDWHLISLWSGLEHKLNWNWMLKIRARKISTWITPAKSKTNLDESLWGHKITFMSSAQNSMFCHFDLSFRMYVLLCVFRNKKLLPAKRCTLSRWKHFVSNQKSGDLCYYRKEQM